MTRTIELELNKFPSLPTTLVDPTTSAPLDTLTVEVKKLFHHYSLAKYGDDEDTGAYEYERRLTTGPDWRFRGSGIGADKETKRNVSNEFGKAFARWFLHEHLGITYFCPFEDLLGRKNPDGTEWRRREDGDLPDYVCGKTKVDVNLLEAKGRHRSLTFRTKEFDTFRAQIQRAQLFDAKGCPLQVKGYVSAARWATEDTPRVRSKLLMEDPATGGNQPGSDGYPRQVGLSMVVGHYAPVLERLQLPLHAEAIRSLQLLPQWTGIKRGIWRCISGPLSGRRFVGGVIPDRFGRTWGPWWPFPDGFASPRPSRTPAPLAANQYGLLQIARQDSPFVLAPPLLFFGVSEDVLQQILRVARQGLDAAGDLEPMSIPEQTGSLSVLRDGTIFGPAHYFEPIGVKEL